MQDANVSPQRFVPVLVFFTRVFFCFLLCVFVFFVYVV